MEWIGVRWRQWRRSPKGARPGTLFKVSLKCSGGENGDATTPATWKYDGFWLDGDGRLLFSGADPEYPRPLGQLSKATMGWGYIQDGVIKLAEAIEPPMPILPDPSKVVAGTCYGPGGEMVGYFSPAAERATANIVGFSIDKPAAFNCHRCGRILPGTANYCRGCGIGAHAKVSATRT